MNLYAVAIATLLVISFFVACQHVGDAFEATCIKGRLGPEQAAAVNAGAWERRPGYCAGETYTDDTGELREGGAHCEAEAGDRVLASHCSTALKVLGTGD